ncbi:MAG: hypothetical protein ACI8XO_001764 [Verrucomicrobiales bacterium]|jgi:uncharacterized protein (DUF58 family)
MMAKPAKKKFLHLDPEVLQRISSLELVAREAVEGMRVGAHRSPLKGLSSEFAYHRPYVFGDSPRHVDWRLYARTGRYYMKQYIAETDFTADILLDASSSMNYGSGDVSKLEYAKTMAASLAHLIVTRRDMAGLAIFDSELRQYIEPSSRLSIVRDIAVELEKVEGVARTNIASQLHEFAQRIKRRGFVILISDLLDNVDDFMKGLNHLQFHGHNVIVFHTLDPYELTFPFDGTCRFKGLEVDEELVTRPKRVREIYLEELEVYLKKIRDACRKTNVDYVLADTSRPLHEVLTAYLMKRSRSL